MIARIKKGGPLKGTRESRSKALHDRLASPSDPSIQFEVSPKKAKETTITLSADMGSPSLVYYSKLQVSLPVGAVRPKPLFRRFIEERRPMKRVLYPVEGCRILKISRKPSFSHSSRWKRALKDRYALNMGKDRSTANI